MQERQLLEVDPLFRDEFFEIPQQTFTLEDLKRFVTFPLPSSANEFNSFQFSANGARFRDGFKAILQELYNIIDGADPLINANIAAFIKTYLNNDGKDIGFTEICMPLYQQGVLFLAGILQLVKNDKIPLEIRQTSVKNLFKQMNVCAPGIYTHISDSYLRLASFLEVKNYFMSYREEMARQLISEKILKLRPHIPAGNDIHYSNAIINLYDDALGLQRIEDLLVRGCCDVRALEDLSALFSADIGKYVTLDNLFDQIIDELKLHEWVDNVSKLLSSGKLEAYNDAVKLLSDKLLRFGPGELPVNRLWVSNEMSEIKGLSVNADYALYISLFERMVASGYVSDAGVSLLADDGGIKIFSLPLRTLKFAYIETKHGTQPLLPFFIESIINESPEANVIDEVITDHPEMHHEVIDYIVRYLSSGDVAAEQHESEGIQNLLFYLAACYPAQWSTIVARLSPAHQDIFMSSLLADIEDIALAEELRNFYMKHNPPLGERLIEIVLKRTIVNFSRGSNDSAVFHAACSGGYLGIAKELLRLKVDVNIQDPHGTTPLMYAAFAGSMPLVNLLLESGANPQLYREAGDTALHGAAWFGHKDIVMKLLEKGAFVNFYNCNGITALHCACVNGDVGIVKGLLDKGANIEARSVDGVTPLQMAITRGNQEVALTLLRAGALPNIPKKNSTALLQILMANNEHAVVEQVLKRMLVRYMSEISEKQITLPAVNVVSKDEAMLAELERREIQSIHDSKIFASSLLYSVLNAKDTDEAMLRRFNVFKSDVGTAARHSKRFSLFVKACSRVLGAGVLPLEEDLTAKNKIKF